MNDYLSWGTLALVVFKYVLDFVAPRTKNKADDKVRDAVDKLPLPSLPDAAKEVMPKDPTSTQVRGFGVARDHR